MILSCAICMIALQCPNSIAPSTQLHLPLKRWFVECLATVSLELELANDSVNNACFSKLEKDATYLVTTANIATELREVCALCSVLDLMLDCYVIAYNYAFCNLI